MLKECVVWKEGTRALLKRVGKDSTRDREKENTRDRRYKGKKAFYLGFTGKAGPGNTTVKKALV